MTRVQGSSDRGVDPRSDPMTAAIFESFGPPDAIRLVQMPTPTPGPGEVLLKTAFASVNPIDCMTRAGVGVPVQHFPGVLGWDVAGTVVAVGSGVTGFREGDAVFGMPRFPEHVGCCAEYVISPADAVIQIPSGLSHREAAAVPLVSLTAWQALDPLAQSLNGLKVLIAGAAGGVGHVAVQIAKYLGAQIVATASERNRAFLTGFGVDEIHDYTHAPVEAVVHDVDVALDTRGGADVARLVQTVKPGGMIISLKGGGDEAAQASAKAKGVRIRSIRVYPDHDMLIQIGERLQDRSIRIEIESEFPLAEIAKAHAVVEAGHVRGKVVLHADAS